VIAEGSSSSAATINIQSLALEAASLWLRRFFNSYLMGNDYYQNLEGNQNQQFARIMNVGIGERCFINNTIVIKIAESATMSNSTAEAFARN